MTILQKLSFPDFNLNSIDAMYYRVNDKVIVNNIEKKFIFKEGGFLKLDTYLNTFSVTTWKYYAGIDDLYISVRGKGNFLFRLVYIQHGCQHKYLREEVIELNKDSVFLTKVDNFQNLGKGIIFPVFTALSEGEIEEVEYLTSLEPVNDVKLGIVITHFNRQKNVKQAVDRLSKTILSNKNLNIDLIIVDNSRNLDVISSDRIKVIPNHNLGGSGGFMRGLLYLEENGYTHALFMDDDASTEEESILRTCRIFQFTNIKKLAISGSLHMESIPGFIYEKGARFIGIYRPIKHMLNVENITGVIEADKEDIKADYGGWRFFAFRIKDVKYLAFPYFVRGDDILFSIVNKFKIHCPLGVYTLGDDFGAKETPLHVYLDIRYHIINSMIKGVSFYKILAVLVYLYFKRLFSYRYESCNAFIMAIKDVLRGPEYFMENVDLSRIRNIINSFVKEEKPTKFDIAEYEFDYPENIPENKILRVLRILTLNGLLIPHFLMKNKVIYHEKTFSADLGKIFRYKKVLYYNSQDETGYVLEHNKRKIITLSIGFFFNLVKLSLSFPFVKRKFISNLENITSKDFWKKVFEKYKVF